ncbi:hypothetical protein [Nautilia sp.]
MKYILAFILFLSLTGCFKNTKQEHSEPVQKEVIQKKPPKKNSVITIKLKDLELKFKENRLIYPKNKTVLLFENNNTFSKAEKLVLKKLNVKFYQINSPYLEKYFNIQYYPTIVVLDKNKTVKYENFTPYEILKAEGF